MRDWTRELPQVIPKTEIAAIAGYERLLNQLRTNPPSFVPLLEDRYHRYQGYQAKVSDTVSFSSYEGAAACSEAIKCIKSLACIKALKHCENLQNYCNSIKDRIPLPSKKFTADPLTPDFDENVYLLTTIHTISPHCHLIDLLIDDGIQKRPNRSILLNPLAEKYGVSLNILDGRAALILAIKFGGPKQVKNSTQQNRSEEHTSELQSQSN